MADLRRIYLDNAATSWPKPDTVYAAVQRAMRELGAPAGRSAYGEAAEVEQAILSARKEVASLIGCDDPRRIVFTLNGTDSLNLAIQGVLRPGDHVVTSVAEHNSVLRPLRALEDEGRVEVSRVPCGRDGCIDPAELRAAVRPSTRLIAITHASNVTGAIQPAAEVGKIAREHGCLFLLDAAQSVGDVPIDVAALGVDLLAAPGHKGLLGPLGTGVLYVRPGVEAQLRSLRQGGTGSRSENDRQPDFLPDKYESGNLNVPGILGLGAGVAYLRQQGIAAIRSHTMQLTERLLAELRAIERVKVYGLESAERRVGIVSVNVAGADPQEVAGILDSAYRIQARSGLHCAPRMHEALGTLVSGGTLRFSIGPFNTSEDIDATIAAVQEVAANV
jgi:cysteine desulfurase family protein